MSHFLERAHPFLLPRIKWYVGFSDGPSYIAKDRADAERYWLEAHGPQVPGLSIGKCARGWLPVSPHPGLPSVGPKKEEQP